MHVIAMPWNHGPTDLAAMKTEMNARLRTVGAEYAVVHLALCEGPALYIFSYDCDPETGVLTGAPTAEAFEPMPMRLAS